MGRIIGGLALIGFGILLFYYGFNDEFSIGQKVQSTLTRNGRPIGDTIMREYGYFDAFKNRVPLIIFGIVSAVIGYSVLKDED